MAKLKLKQILSNLQYDPSTDQLILKNSESASFLISGSVEITSTPTVTGSLTINGIDTFGDSGSFDTVDLGSY
jgi:membrane-associated PAP2 superfamily phosphatase